MNPTVRAFLLGLTLALAGFGVGPVSAQTSPLPPASEELKTRVVALAVLPGGTLASGSTFGVVLWDAVPPVPKAETQPAPANPNSNEVAPSVPVPTVDPNAAWRTRPRPGGFMLPDAVTGFQAVGNLLVVAHGAAGITLLDVSDTTQIRFLANLLLPGAALDVTLDDTGLLWVAMGTMGLAVVDISNAQSPKMLATVQLEGHVRHLAVLKVPLGTSDSVIRSRVWVAAGKAGLIELEMDQTHQVVSQRQLDAGQEVRRVLPYGAGLLFSRGSGGVCYLPLTKAAEPLAAQCVTGQDVVRDMVVWGDKVVVADGGAGVMVADFSTPQAPRYVGHLGGAKFSANRLFLQDDLLYIAADAAGVLAIPVNALPK